MDANNPRPRLPMRLQQIADVVTRLGEASATDVTEQLEVPLSSSAVRSMLQRLEAKGVLHKRVEGNRYIYRPALATREVRRALLDTLAQHHFGGSLAAMSAELRRMMAEVPDGSGDMWQGRSPSESGMQRLRGGAQAGGG
jgi:predicted transcriptional regulator